jgi:hypothetical protein
MNGAVFSKLEIDIMQAHEIMEAANLLVKYNLPAMVVHPNLSGDAMIARSKVGGRYKIITPVDWSKGDTFGDKKLRGLSIDSIETDGFEILLTAGVSETDTRNEARVLTEFIKHRIGELIEVRFVLGTTLRASDQIEVLCKGLLDIRTPSMIRTDVMTKTQTSKANTEEHNKAIKLVKSFINAPIKLSGNFNAMKSIAGCSEAARFAVSITQAKAIIKEFNNQSSMLSEVLSLPEENT